MKKSKLNKGLLKKIIAAVLVLAVVGVLAVGGVNAYMILSVKPQILTVDEAAKLEDADCIIVLGCLVYSDSSPSKMLADRLSVGVELYKSGAAPKLLMSGDHGRENYDEVNAMRTFAMENDIEAADIFMDHAGFSTYETMYRAKEIFQAKKVVIVTQGYHIYRAVYDAQRLGLEAYGVASDLHTYGTELHDNIRESAARCKDFAYCLIKPKPTYLGEAIPIMGDGTATQD